MRKLALIMAAVATLVSSSGYAQTPSGKAAKSGQSTGMSSGFAWGVAVVGVAVVAAVAAGTGASSGGSHSSFGH
jgi:hypothetical protein